MAEVQRVARVAVARRTDLQDEQKDCAPRIVVDVDPVGQTLAVSSPIADSKHPQIKNKYFVPRKIFFFWLHTCDRSVGGGSGGNGDESVESEDPAQQRPLGRNSRENRDLFRNVKKQLEIRL